MRQIARQVDQFAILIDIENVFNPHPEFFFRDIDSGLKGKHRPRTQRNVVVIGIVNIQSDVVAEAMNEVFSQRLAVQVFAMGVDVVVSDVVERIRPVPPQTGLARLKCRRGSLLRAQHDVVNLPLPRGEFAGTGRVRVMSEAYMEYSPAASITTTSPACMVPESSE